MRRSLLALVLVLAASTVPAGAAATDPGGTFRDDDGNVHEGMIEAVAAAGITRGCNPPTNDRYCPDDTVTRGQMAAFLVRALALPAGATTAFTDDDDSEFETEIESLASAGVTRGCNPPANDRYCPDDPVTRGQMAAFLVRAYAYVGDTSADRFADDDASVFEDDIEILAANGVTLGCNPPDNDRFCPDDPVRRDQMASFLGRAEGLTAIVPPQRCPVFPADNVWNTRVDGLPVHPRSDEYIASIGPDATLHPDFGSGVWPPESTSPIGIPFVVVGDEQADVRIEFTAYGDESDPGPYPVPADAPVEGGLDADGDRHVLVVDTDDCVLYELYRAFPLAGGAWSADSAARWDLTSHALRPAGWTSADAAGLPIYPGLVRFDEVAAGEITHAIRFTVSETQRAYVWPARHFASDNTSESVPPMGQRFRLRSDYDISGFSQEIQVILTAFQRYGIIVADNGSDWYISGAPDERWDNDVLRQLKSVPGSAFEAVDMSSLIVDEDSGQAG
jgi:hypothetical protein